MGEQAVTGAEAVGDGSPGSGAPAAAGMNADGSTGTPGALPGAGMSADGPAGATAAVPGAGMQADAESGTGTQAADTTGGAAGGTGPQSRTADIVPGPGGVMTDEVGVVTGDLTLRTEWADGRVTLRVQYKDADEWYVVTGGTAALADPAGLDAVHGIALGLLNRPEG